MGSPRKEGEIRLEVDKIFLNSILRKEVFQSSFPWMLFRIFKVKLVIMIHSFDFGHIQEGFKTIEVAYFKQDKMVILVS